VPFALRRIESSLRLEVPRSEPAAIGTRDDRVVLERAGDVAPACRVLPPEARRALALREGDMLYERSPHGLFVLLRRGAAAGADRARVSLVRFGPAGPREVPIAPPLWVEQCAHAFQVGGRELVLSHRGGTYRVNADDGTAERLGSQPGTPVSVACVSRERVLLLSRLDRENCELTLQGGAAPERWAVTNRWHIHAFDQLHYLPSRGLVVLSFAYMPERLSLAALLRLTGDGPLQYVTHAPIQVADAFEAGGHAYLESATGSVYRIAGLEEWAAAGTAGEVDRLCYTLPRADYLPPELSVVLRRE
jgi:hypothetical protein